MNDNKIHFILHFFLLMLIFNISNGVALAQDNCMCCSTYYAKAQLYFDQCNYELAKTKIEEISAACGKCQNCTYNIEELDNKIDVAKYSKAPNIKPTDLFCFYFITEDSIKSTTLYNSFTLPYCDVLKSNSLSKLLEGFSEYLLLEKKIKDKTAYLANVKVFRIIDEVSLPINIDKVYVTLGGNNGLIIAPQKVIDEWGEHLFFVYVKSLVNCH